MSKFRFRIKKTYGLTYFFFKFDKEHELYILPHMKILKTKLMPLICFSHCISNNDGKYKILDLIENYDEQL